MCIDSIRLNIDAIECHIGKNVVKLKFPKLQMQSKLSDNIYTAIRRLACENKIAIEADATTQEKVYRLPVIYNQHY